VEITDAAIAVNISLAPGSGTTNDVTIERTSTGAVAITTGSGADDVFAERVTVRHGAAESGRGGGAARRHDPGRHGGPVEHWRQLDDRHRFW
jgi:hypothetical protein